MEALQRQLNQMNASQKQVLICDFCGGDHDSMECQGGTSSEQINSMGNFQGVKTTSISQFKTYLNLH